MSKILKVKARQVFDSRGNPTIEAEVFTLKIIVLQLYVLLEHQLELMKHLKKRDKNNKRLFR